MSAAVLSAVWPALGWFALGWCVGVAMMGWAYERPRQRRAREIDRALDDVSRARHARLRQHERAAHRRAL